MFMIMQCLSIFKAIVRVFSKSKRTSRGQNGIPEAQPKNKKNRELLSLSKSRKQRNRVADVRCTKVDILPNELLLEIFDFHRLATLCDPSSPWQWHRLAHVSQRWRHVVFSSPCRLDLRLVYTYKNPVRKTVDLWPVFPISIWYPVSSEYRRLTSEDEGNVLAVLKHPARICEVNLAMSRQLTLKTAGSMGASFPMLELLHLRSQDTMRTLTIPDGFLGRSTPRLRDIHLVGTAFPALPSLLLSAEALVSVRLDEVPNAGYFSPEAIANGLSKAVQLKVLKIDFLPPNTHERSIDASPPSRAILPALIEFVFKGNPEYLEDLVSRIDTPALEQINITFLERPTFGIPRLSRFISRIKELKSPYHMSIDLYEDDITITHHSRRSSSDSKTFQLQIPCEELDHQIPLIIHVCRHLSEHLSGVERLDIEGFPLLSLWTEREEVDSTLWLELFRPFRGVKRLELTCGLVTSVSSALERVAGEMARTVLPALRDLYLLDSLSSVPSSIEQFVAARQLSNHPVAVHLEKDGSLDHGNEDD
ncbi:hypothetical protein BC827DRAFT_1222011 [Russula dissimulans]|nr:hypothetical protein BC827DRAFT_1222011 [Russula dissimulans]